RGIALYLLNRRLLIGTTRSRLGRDETLRIAKQTRSVGLESHRPRAFERRVVLCGAEMIEARVVALVDDEVEFVAGLHDPLHAEISAEFARKIVVLGEQAELEIRTEGVGAAH